MAKMADPNEQKMLMDAESGKALDKWVGRSQAQGREYRKKLGYDKEIDALVTKEIEEPVKKAADKAWGRPPLDTEGLVWKKAQELFSGMASDLVVGLKAAMKDEASWLASRNRLAKQFGKATVDKAYDKIESLGMPVTKLLVMEKANSGKAAGESGGI